MQSEKKEPQKPNLNKSQNQQKNQNDNISPVYAHLASDRVLFLSEEITLDETASSLTSMLIYHNLTSPSDDITLFINTVGGDVPALFNIYDIMHMITAPVNTICIGKAYSAGAVILASGASGKRFMTKNSLVMIHGIQSSFPNTPFADIEYSDKYLKYLYKYNEKIIKILAKHTGKSVSKIKKDCERDLFLDAKDCLKYGIIDKII